MALSLWVTVDHLLHHCLLPSLTMCLMIEGVLKVMEAQSHDTSLAEGG